MTGQDMQTVIQLTTPEHYPINPDLFPTITHCRIVNVKIEMPRPIDDKAGKVTIWVAKGFLNGGDWFYEAPGLPGEEIVIDEPELWEFGSAIIVNGNVMPEFLKTVSQFLIDKGYVNGTVIVITG